jgi:hypothetical protein
MSEEETIDFPEADTDTVDQVELELLISHSSMLDKLAERERLNQEIERFLLSGGCISHIDENVMADPPRKPENKYGSHPI